MFMHDSLCLAYKTIRKRIKVIQRRMFWLHGVVICAYRHFRKQLCLLFNLVTELRVETPF